jgi:uncharacterized protein (TIGR03067 family)
MVPLLVAGTLLVGAPVPKALHRKHPPDPERLLGAWRIVEENGGPPRGADIIWTFTAGKMHSSSGNTDWTIRLDPDQSPKHIDITDYPGIYEFDGDKLKIAYTTGRQRPTDFTRGNGVSTNVLERADDPPKK